MAHDAPVRGISALGLLLVAVVGALSAGAASATSPIVPSTSLLVYAPQPANRAAVRTVVFVNRGTSSAVLGPVAVHASGVPAFALASDSCGSEIAELAAGSACAYVVVFHPPSTGRFRAVLQYGNGGSIVGAVKLVGVAVAGGAGVRRAG